ncbi:cytochrome c-type biogenesis protein [Pseudoteredinibacter isoporae]|uniref:Cytochrome c-type biogenesis protein n=1 Tax=Pseudoteredinibacter isoporae TaxID=570281 RepID=A0A7X0MX87_9GAMM|nr:cytochrome c-type biogenesis protein [Pseudoteredinibacter isoporae]MBB6521794.1 cytochrome c-type biogenesis protein CcmH [Pseudoteredinibacter isoporae]NHO87340.1 cytochrome c-type biogenesis protein CcmH [Pseudoteredinibacter isoporae]NIB23028.1 cytochrome c-type biogenesis protein CcmH [Pseudoteredinibacter isoporae]
MTLINRCFFLLFLFITATSAQAVVDLYEFDDPSLRERYLVLVDELRCPKCQNQNLSGSDSPIASDLRRELHRLLQEGQSDEEIKDYMVARYGDYVLYRPRLGAKTLLLWGGPIALLLLGLIVAFFIFRRQAPVEQTVEIDKERLDEILREAREEKEKDQN